MPRTDKGFSSGQVVAIAGVTRRQLAYWRKTGLIVPAHLTPGGHARYGFTDLIALKTAKRLLDAGVSVQRLRASIAALNHFLPTVTRPLTELSIVVAGEVILVLHVGHAFDALTGQEWILPVAELHQQLARLQDKPSAHPPVQCELFPPPAHQPTDTDHRQSEQQPARPTHRAGAEPPDGPPRLVATNRSISIAKLGGD